MKQQILLLILIFPLMTQAQEKVHSQLCIMDPDSKEVTVVYDADYHLEAPNWTPDGKYIYFNSTRTGTMQIWRMKNDGSEQTQITFDSYNDWFAHPSPDNKLLQLFGGQGTINVPSWSPDSKQFAFVQYKLK